MTLAEELLEVAQILLNVSGPPVAQAAIRRSISTAYYALFHLLIGEATENWNRPEFRSALGRIFEHGNMRSVSERMAADLGRKEKSGIASPAEQTLNVVAVRFVRCQQRRIDADYVTSRQWTHSDCLEQIEDVTNAFAAWSQIRNEPIAQAYLVAMLNKRATPGSL